MTAFRNPIHTRAWLLVLAAALLFALPVTAQQTGSVSGRITSPDGAGLPGVQVTAESDVLPQERVTMTGPSGRYEIAQLPPGEYTLTYTLDGLATEARTVDVLLQQNSQVDLSMTAEGVTETVEVIGAAVLIDRSSAELKAAVTDETIDRVPVGQEYRDLIKLIPGVQYSEDSVRGPSAGGSGQDNVYLFDGVNVGLPLFGVLSAEPSSHDIAQIAVVKGGAKAQDFNRSGGFTINSVSKTGTNAYHGEVSFQVQTEDMTGDRDTGSDAEFEQDRDWTVASVGGPIVPENLFFYASYYRPTVSRDSRANLYGDVPDFDSERDELFGKLTFQPTSSLLLNGSYRDSDREVTGSSVGGEATAGTASTGSDATLEIAILEGSYIINNNSYLSFKYTDFANETASRPDTLLGFDAALDGSQPLNVGALDSQGLFFVPQPIAGEAGYNAFIQPLINQYGYLEGGTPTGGGVVGAGSTINVQDFFREAYEVNYDIALGANVTHDLHIGYQWSSDEEDLARRSNGWGAISVVGGRDLADDGTPIFYRARLNQQGLVSPVINSEFESQSIEINDTIQWNNFSFNLGLMASNDELYGEGLRPNPSTPSGFEVAVGNPYKMYEIDWDETLSPRLGAIWSPNGRDTVYANYALYYPAASSLPRAASWARNLVSRIIDADFDAQGNLLQASQVSSSSGKFFQDGMDPRSIEEFLVGYSRQINSRLTGKAHVRYRYGSDFWEDTNNNARLRFDPPAGIPQELYIPELDDWRFGPQGVGGSSYVIAELDGAFTKYWEASLDAEYRSSKAYVKGSYVWSHYYGNFDQDNTTTSNDQAIFVGSSFLADGAGRQLWDFKYGNLRGDRRHQFKVYGFYELPWNATAGAFAIFQSGQPWEAWNVEVYRDLTGSTSDTNRYGEPAGSRTTDDHWQLDLNYTQNFLLAGRYTIQVRADLFNVFDEQTGYDIQNKVNSANFGSPRDFFDPRRFQLAVKFRF